MKSWLKSKLKKNLIRAEHVFHPPNLIVLNFHQVTDSFNPKKHSKGTWTQVDFFKRQLEYLRDNFELISLRKMHDNFKHLSIALTFDDGDPSILDVVIPILESYKIPATFFLNTAYMDSNGCAWPNLINYIRNINEALLPESFNSLKNKLRNTTNNQEYLEILSLIEPLKKIVSNFEKFTLSLRDIEKIKDDLFTIGLHGHEHQRFSRMSKEWQMQDLKRNVEVLSKFNNYLPIFAIPFGKSKDWNQDTLQICKNLGLEVMAAQGGYNPKNYNDIYKRIPADGLELSKILKVFELK